jgi:hypothetical protein
MCFAVLHIKRVTFEMLAETHAALCAKCPLLLSDFTKIGMLRHVLAILPNKKCHENPFSGSRLSYRYVGANRRIFATFRCKRSKTRRYIKPNTCCQNGCCILHHRLATDLCHSTLVCFCFQVSSNHLRRIHALLVTVKVRKHDGYTYVWGQSRTATVFLVLTVPCQDRMFETFRSSYMEVRQQASDENEKYLADPCVGRKLITRLIMRSFS